MLVFVARYSIIANFDSSGLENVFFALAARGEKLVSSVTSGLF
jgi:hypothetical protein